MPNIVPENTKQKESTSKIVLVAAAIVLVIYIAGVVFFSGRFFPQTHLGALDVSGKTYAQAESLIAERAQNYSIDISGQDFQSTINPQELDFDVDAPGSVQAAKPKKNAFTWPISIFKKHTYANIMLVSFDEDALTKMINDVIVAFNKDKQPPSNATIVFDKERSAFTIQQEALGKQLDVDYVEQKVAYSLKNLGKSSNLPADALLRPDILSNDTRLGVAVQKANAYCDVETTFVAEKTGEKMLVLDANVLSDWVELDKDVNVVFNEEKRLKWATEIAKAMNTVGSKRTYVRPNGNKEVTVEGGDYGWEIDTDHVIEAINAAIENKTKGEVELKFSAPGNGYVDENRDFGAYCDVDLTEQHAYYYDENGKLLWESGIVSGLPAEGNDTPTGAYYVKGKETNVVLRGKIDPKTKKPEYESPVAYWIPFIGNSYGLHDASWQPASAFEDKTSYQWRGSHGCVNLPTDKVAKLYDIIQPDDPVIIHW